LENAPTSTVIYTAIATDADGTAPNKTVTYSIKPGVDDFDSVVIDTTTGEVTLKAVADYETKDAYRFTVVAADGGSPSKSAEKSVVVYVTDVAADPTVELDSQSDPDKDGVTNNKTPSFIITTAPGAKVDFKLTKAGSAAAEVIKTDTADSEGKLTVTITGAGLETGRYVINVEAAFGGETGVFQGMFEVDLTPPTVSAPDLVAASDTGSNPTDNVTNSTTPTFEGTAEKLAEVTLTLTKAGSPPVVLSPVTAGTDGKWSATVASALGAGDWTVVAKAKDSAGNETTSSGLVVKVVTATPASPTAPDLVDASDSGVSNSDNVTNVRTPTFAGTTAVGTTVEVFKKSTALGSPEVSLGPAVVNAAGQWTLAVAPGVAFSTDGEYEITAKATDSAGNAGAASTALRIKIDTAGPDAPLAPDLVAASDSGSNDTDNLTNDTTPTFNGTAEAGATVEVFATKTGAAAVSLGTVVAAGDRTWEFPTPNAKALADGEYDITVKATDVAGNPGQSSLPLTIKIDTTAPVAPSKPDLVEASDSAGDSAADDITNVKLPAFTGIAEKGSRVELIATKPDGTTVSIGAGTADDNGKWTILSTVSFEPDGGWLVEAKATDASGNVSAPSTGLVVNIDTIAPIAPDKPDLDASSDSGQFLDDDYTNDTTPLFKGQAEPNAVVEVFAKLQSGGGAAVSLGKVRSNATTGSWQFQTPDDKALAIDGVYEITAKATDVAGNTGNESTKLEITIDTTKPAAPTFGTVTPSPRNTFVSSLPITFNEEVFGVDLRDFGLTQTVAGRLVPTIPLQLAGTATVRSDSGSLGDDGWTLDGLAKLTGTTATYDLSLRAAGSGIADRAGNLLTDDATRQWITDTSAPKATIAAVQPAVRSTAVNAIAVQFSEAVTGVTVDDFVLTRVVGNASTAVAGFGLSVTGTSWSVNGLTVLTGAEGTYTLRLKASGSGIKDGVGNDLFGDASTTWIVDKTAPTLVRITNVATPRTTPVDTISIVFSEAVRGVEVADLILTRDGSHASLAGVTIGPVAGQAGNFVVNGLRTATTQNGTYKLTLRKGTGTPIQDEAGNLLAADVATADWKVDRTAPTATIALTPVVASPSKTPITSATIQFSEDVTGVTASDFRLTRNGAIVPLEAGDVSGGPTTYTLELAAHAATDGRYELTLVAAGSGIVDAAGNPLVAGVSRTWQTDRVGPVPVLSIAGRVGTRFTMKVVFDEAVNGFTIGAGDVGVTNGVASNLRNGAKVGREFLFDVVPATSAPARVVIKAGAVTDSLETASFASNEVTLQTDFTAPGVTLTTAKLLTNATAVTVTATFSEDVTGLTTDDFVVLNGAATALTPAGSAKVFTLTVAPAADGKVTVSLPSGRATDASGNGNAASNALVFTSDRTRPSVTLAGPASGVSRDASIRITATFSEPVTGVQAADLTVVGGAVTSVTGSGSAYVFFVTPAADGNVVVRMTADKAVDAAGNGNTATAADVTVRSDRTRPQAAIVAVGGGRFEIRFTEAVARFDKADLRLTRNGELLSLAAAPLIGTAANVWTINVGALITRQANYQLRLVAAGSGIVDAPAGNPLAIDAVASFSVDATLPSAAFTGVPAITNAEVLAAGLLFSEPVTGVDPADLELYFNGVPVAWTGVAVDPVPGSLVAYRVTWSPAGRGDGVYSLRLNAAAAAIIDGSGNPLGQDALVTWRLDTQAPVATIQAVSPSPRTTPVTALLIEFDEPVKGVDSKDFSLTRNGVAVQMAAATLSAVGTSGRVFQLGNLAGLTGLAGDYVLTLRAVGTGIVDAAGNGPAADAAVAWSNTGSTVPGVVTASFVPVTPSPRTTPVSAITLGFSAPVTGVDAGDFVLTRTVGGLATTLTGLSVSGTNAQRTIGNLAAITGVPGAYTLRLKSAGSGIATAAGALLGADAVASWVVQAGPTSPPVVMLTQVAPPSAGSAVDAVAVGFDRAVTGVTLNAFRLFRNGASVSLSGVVLTGTGDTYQVRGLAPLTAVVGNYELRLVAAGSGIKDSAGAALAGNGSTAWAQAATQLRAAFLGVDGLRSSPVAGIALRFSAAVRGVDLSDFELVRDGVVVRLAGVSVSGSGTSWTVGNLRNLQTAPGTYTLRLKTANGDIRTATGLTLAEEASVSWTIL
jgi:hypothetical protein